MSIQTLNNKRYEKYDITNNLDIFGGYVGNIEIDTAILKRLAKDLGFSYEVYHTLKSVDSYAANAMARSMSIQSKHSEVLLLIDDELNQVIDYTLDCERPPVLNSDFVHRLESLSETSESVELVEVHYHKDDRVSSAILRKKSPIIIEEKYENKESKVNEYSIGLLIVNDEVNSVYSRLVLYVGDQPLYLPASYYNTTTSRYRRSTNSSTEALEVLVLKAIDDLREDSLHSKIYDLHFRYRANKNILASYEEYNKVLSTMRKIPTVIEDNSFLSSLQSQYEVFEEKYNRLEDQKSSYIWRCTALSDLSVGALVNITSKILSDVSAPTIEYFAIRELLGSYVSTNRIAEEIAKEDQ